MPEVIPSIEDDPCARATALKAKRDLVISGEGVAEFDSEHGNGVRRRVKYTAANLNRLDAEISKADAACALSQGKRPRRHAITPLGRGW